MRISVEFGLILGFVLSTIRASPQTLSTMDVPSMDIKSGQESEGFPGIASLQDAKGASFCGGALIASDLIMTAAHCIVANPPADIYVQIGENSLDKANLTERIRGLSIHYPPKFRGLVTHKQEVLDINHDIALLRLSKSSPKPIMKINSSPNPIKVGEEATAVGWGRLDGSTKNPSPRNLNQVDLVLSDGKSCEKTFQNYNNTDSYCFRATKNNPKGGTCMGDSGSPMIFNESAIGVVSAGSTKCDDDLAIYTRTDPYLAWLKNFIDNRNPKEDPLRVISLG